MTAEVAIINSTGIALAADSAVTIGGKKTYDSALKLFALSKTEPVGIMIYGNAAFMNVPWETIIKIYRKQAGGDSFGFLTMYSDSFFSFLESRADFFPKESQEKWLLSSVLGYYKLVFSDFIKVIERKIEEKGKISEKETSGYFEEVVEKHHSNLFDRDFLDGFSKTFEAEIRKRYSSKFKDLRDDVFKEFPIPLRIVRKLNHIASMIHSRDIFSESVSGVVIAGFGNEDLYPNVETNEIDGIIGGRIRKKRLENKSIKVLNGGECAVIAFAQDDMVGSFMSGLDPSIYSFILSYLNRVFERLPELIDRSSLEGDESSKDNMLAMYGNEVTNLLNDFFGQLNTHTQQQYVQPIMQMVNALPKDELAAMAESLVNLTAFKRRVTRTLETVGGPIDVAVISKGDGLVWVKRKHYFPKELNHHFFSNYYQEA